MITDHVWRPIKSAGITTNWITAIPPVNRPCGAGRRWSMSAHFTAQYAGRCTNCGQPFEVGAPLFYTDDDALSGWECCGLSEQLAAASEETQRVMPRGKTVRDACGRCFQVPASNGMCGCDS